MREGAGRQPAVPPRVRGGLGWGLLVCLLFLAPAAVAAVERATLTVPGSPPSRIEADTINVRANGLTDARGNVVLTRPPDVLRADTATFNPATGDIRAEGNVLLTRPEGDVRSEALRYNLDTGAASAEVVRAAVTSPERPDVTYYVEGQGMSRAGNEFRLQSGLFSTCGPEHRHWAVRAREIVLRLDEQVVARGVSLSLFGNRLFTVPRLSFDLGEHRGPGLLPRLVAGRRDLIGVRGDYRLGLPAGLQADGYAVLSARHTIRAGAGVQRFGSVPIGLRAGFKEDATSRFVSGLTVTVIPAVTFFLPAEVGPRTGPLLIGLRRPQTPVQMLGGDVDGGPWESGCCFRFLASGSAGRFIEHPTETIANRLNLAGALEMRPQGVMPHLALGAALRGRAAFYSKDAHYTVLSPEVSLEWEPSTRDRLRLGWRSFDDAGSTPFFFDRIDTPRALRLSWDNRTTQRAFNVDLEYDLTRNTLYGWEVGYSKRFHCLQPGLSLRSRGGDFNVGVTLEIPGIGGGR